MSRQQLEILDRQIDAAKAQLSELTDQRIEVLRRLRAADDRVWSIARYVAECLGVDIRDVMGQSRRQSVILARTIVWMVLRECSPMSFMEIGLAFDDRDHTTILQVLQNRRKQILDEPDLRSVYDAATRRAQLLWNPEPQQEVAAA